MNSIGFSKAKFYSNRFHLGEWVYIGKNNPKIGFYLLQDLPTYFYINYNQYLTQDRKWCKNLRLIIPSMIQLIDENELFLYTLEEFITTPHRYLDDKTKNKIIEDFLDELNYLLTYLYNQFKRNEKRFYEIHNENIDRKYWIFQPKSEIRKKKLKEIL